MKCPACKARMYKKKEIVYVEDVKIDRRGNEVCRGLKKQKITYWVCPNCG